MTQKGIVVLNDRCSDAPIRPIAYRTESITVYTRWGYHRTGSDGLVGPAARERRRSRLDIGIEKANGRNCQYNKGVGRAGAGFAESTVGRRGKTGLKALDSAEERT